MANLDIAIERARTLLLEAALDSSRWPDALDAFARACNARTGQLIDLNGSGEIKAHWITEMPDGFTEAIEAFGLSDPRVNPRMRLGANTRRLQPVADQDHVDPETRARHPIYAELFDPAGVSFNCQAVVRREIDRLTRASVSRTHSQGPMDAEAFRAFEALVPYVETAVRFQTTLTMARINASMETLDAAGAVAFLLDEDGRVMALSQQGEALVRAGDILDLRGQNLQPALLEDRRIYAAQVAKALATSRGESSAPGGTLVLRSGAGGRSMTFDIQPLPRERPGLGRGPAVLIVAQAGAESANRLETVMRCFGLTRSEADVAIRLAEGDALPLIAESRAVSIGTVRAQIRAIYAKMGVHRQAELVLAIRKLG